MSSDFRFSYNLSPGRFPQTILFLHGFLGCKEDWSEIATALRDEFRMLTVDLPGHGSMQTAEVDVSYGMKQVARGLIELLDSLGIAKCHLVGYSMGGRLALYLAVKYHDRIDRLVLESASPGLTPAAARGERRRQDRELARKLETVSMSRFLEDWYAQPLFSSLKRHPRFPELLQRRMRNRPVPLARSLREMGTGAQPSLWKYLKSVRQSVLFIAGNEDIKFREIALQMAAQCPNGRAAIIENAGHTVHFEQPDAYIRTVQAFFNEDK